jgi:N-acetylmuramoyl-L-alanine amidase
LVVAGEASAADAPTITGIRIGGDRAATRVVVESDRPLDDPLVFTLAQQGARVVIDFAHAEFSVEGAAIGGSQRKGPGQGLVADYRFAHNSPTRSRIVLDLAAPAALARQTELLPSSGSPGYRLVIDLASTTADEFAAGAGLSRDRVPHPTPLPPPADKPGRGDPGREDQTRGPVKVVVLDPGHGGSDSGAKGARGALEKDVNLALALLVRDRLEAAKRYRVVMTRSDDRRVDLDERVRIARDAGADLFLSIHANAVEQGGGASPSGASVYTLAESAEGRSRREIFRPDPRILNVDLDNRQDGVGDILFDLVHRDTQNQSSAFAEALIPALGRAGPLLRNTHRSAGYYVLLAPDVPAVLLEAGFLTNPQDEARLTSPEQRGAIAEALAAGVDSYFQRREQRYAGR